MNPVESKKVALASDRSGISRIEVVDVFDFLDNLRESGITNMFGATPYIQQEFGYDKKTARTLLTTWMETFGEEDEK